MIDKDSISPSILHREVFIRVVSNRVVGDLMVEVGGEEHRWGASDSRRDRDGGGEEEETKIIYIGRWGRSTERVLVIVGEIGRVGR